jgi:anti-sigma B factor antagonist
MVTGHQARLPWELASLYFRGAATRDWPQEIPLSIVTSTRLVDGVVIVDVIGQLKLGQATGVLRNVVHGLLSEGYTKIVLNFNDVLNVDSCGVGEMLAAHTAVRNQGGELKLLNLSKHVKNLLHITRLFTIFQTYESQADAVQSFQAGMGAKV